MRLENRLGALEQVKAKAEKEIDRLGTEMARANEDLARAFPQVRQLDEARDRAARLDQQLQEAARAQLPDNRSESVDGTVLGGVVAGAPSAL